MNLANIASNDIDGYPLTENGLNQAVMIGEELGKIKNIDIIFSSPIQRARETAEIISKYVTTKSKEMRLDNRLVEMQMGRLNNKKKPDDSSWKLEKEKYRLESFDSMKNRINSFVSDLPDGLFLVVTHKELIAVTIGMIFDMDLESSVSSGPGNCRFVVVDFEKNKLMALNAWKVSNRLISQLGSN